MSQRTASILICMVLCAWASLGAHAATPVPMVSDGQALARIVLDSDPDPLNRVVADDVTGIVQRMTGASLPAGEVAGLLPIYIGEPTEFADFPFAVPALAEEEFLLKVTPGPFISWGGAPSARPTGPIRSCAIWAVAGSCREPSANAFLY